MEESQEPKTIIVECDECSKPFKFVEATGHTKCEKCRLTFLHKALKVASKVTGFKFGV